jgi:hypothetical protein
MPADITNGENYGIILGLLPVNAAKDCLNCATVKSILYE